MIISHRSRRRCSGYGDLPAGRQTERIQLILHIFARMPRWGLTARWVTPARTRLEGELPR